MQLSQSLTHTRYKLTGETTEQDALVAFLKSLTDDRVRCSRAPFDHPELLIPDGHKPDVVKKDGRLADKLRTLQPVGAGGMPSSTISTNASRERAWNA